MRRRTIWAQAANKRPAPAQRDIRAEYEARFGKPPHHRMKSETIEAKLRDDDTRNSRA